MPVLVVTVEHDGRLGIARDVAQPLQRLVPIALGLAVDGDVEPVFRQAETDRNDMRGPARIGGRQAADPLPVNEVTFERR